MTAAGSAPLPLIIKFALASALILPFVRENAPEIVRMCPLRVMSPTVCVSIPAIVRSDPSVTVPDAVRLMVRLLMVVLPVVARVPNVPLPLIVMLEVPVTFKKFELGVKLPSNVRVKAATDKLPFVKVRLPVIVVLAAKVTPDELFITV